MPAEQRTAGQTPLTPPPAAIPCSRGRALPGHERVEEGIELVVARARGAQLGALGAQDAAQALSLLSAAARVAADLDEHVGLGDVQAVVAHLPQVRSRPRA